ncbi:MAG: integration host factor subunit beta [Alphaproteobacteria bacterium]|nr:integration host factor subunit beta [Alphaproteobacteria bacterium]
MRVNVMGNTTKSEIIQSISNQNLNLSNQDVELIVNKIFAVISEQLSSGGRVEFRNFGCFDVKTRKAGMVRNPQTGEKIEVPEKLIPYFRAGKLLKERINKEK